MSKANNLTDFLTDLANTIRSITGGSALIDPQDFASIIQNLPQPLFKSLVDRSITEITAEDLQGMTNIGNNAFTECRQLRKVSLPESITLLGENAFQACFVLEGINIPSGISTISSFCFYNCRVLKELIIPSGVSEIGASAFRYCLGMEKFIILREEPPTLTNVNAFDNSAFPIYVPASSVDTYKAATNWLSLASRIFPLVNAVTDLPNIDTTIYTKACVIGNDEYIPYVYDGTSWNVAQ